MPEVNETPVATPDSTPLPDAKAVVVGPGSMGTDGWKSAWRHGLTAMIGAIGTELYLQFGDKIKAGDFSFLSDWHSFIGVAIAGAVGFLMRGGWYSSTEQKEVVSNAP